MEQNQTDQNGDEGVKRESATYPYFPLPSAIKVADALKELGGARVAIQKSILASHLKEPEKSPVLQQRIASAKCFGLIEGRSTFMLSEIGKRYFFPTTDSERPAALIELLVHPSAFREIIKRFDGAQVPTREILANIFHREGGVPDSWKERIAASFLKSAEFAGALGDGGFLRVRARKEGLLSKAVPESTIEPMQTTKESVNPSISTSPEIKRESEPIESNAWNFTYKGKTVRLITPTELDNALWEKLDAYVSLLKPTANK